MARYFETAKAIVERHGGTVEKFIGDAVMAVFGVPAVHEDDALRAVRAADELRGALGELNEELERDYGTRLELRMGVNTGEVVTGTEERARDRRRGQRRRAARAGRARRARCCSARRPTARARRGRGRAGRADRAKGKAEPLPAYRLLVVSEAPGRTPRGARWSAASASASVLESAFASVVDGRSCHLFTILGAAGVGKSRLAEEFLRDARRRDRRRAAAASRTARGSPTGR